MITTVAGNGTSGYGGDGGPATVAHLPPSGVAVDAAGNLFIADTGNNAIREVDHATGVITTVAGTGTAGDAGDGGPATTGQLNEPFGVAVDSSGNLFIDDYSNNEIRKVSYTTGLLTTVAGTGIRGHGGDGGPASAAQLNYPWGIATDAAGDLLIADTSNNRIREVTSGALLVTVNKATPTITWNAPGAISYGTALSSTQLDATADVAGTFAYTPASGTVLNVGNNQTLSATFTPTDATDYIVATVSVSINVEQAAWQASIGLYAPATSTFYLWNTTSLQGSSDPGSADATFVYGQAGAGWIPIAGDWDDNGTDTIGLYNPHTSVFYLRNTNTLRVCRYDLPYGPARPARRLPAGFPSPATGMATARTPSASTTRLRPCSTCGTRMPCRARATWAMPT